MEGGEGVGGTSAQSPVSVLSGLNNFKLFVLKTTICLLQIMYTQLCRIWTLQSPSSHWHYEPSQGSTMTIEITLRVPITRVPYST